MEKQLEENYNKFIDKLQYWSNGGMEKLTPYESNMEELGFQT